MYITSLCATPARLPLPPTLTLVPFFGSTMYTQIHAQSETSLRFDVTRFTYLVH